MTCLLLENGLPDSIDGVTIYPDYRNMIRFEQILDDSALNDVEKTVLGVKQLFEELPPGGMAQAVDRLQWFYRRGRDLKDGHTGVGKSNARAYDLVIDAGCIYASFLQAYRIDLTEIRFLHWWAFTALLENLPEDTPMAQRMHLRTMELSAIKDAKLRQPVSKNAEAGGAAAQVGHTHSARGKAVRAGRAAVRGGKKILATKQRDRLARRPLNQFIYQATASFLPQNLVA